jgi:hypothetical protein
MPPQQGYRLPDFVDNIQRFRAHGWLIYLDCVRLNFSRRDTYGRCHRL